MLKVLVSGSSGRMGRSIASVADAYAVEVVTDVSSEVDVIVDFSAPEAIEGLLALKKPVVIGTTGFSEGAISLIEEASKEIPILISGNFAIGVNVLFYLVEKAAGILDKEYQAEILELHHQYKKDAPSGTAKDLLAAIEKARGASKVKHGREGITGKRSEEEVGMHAVRCGDIVGEHTVFFAGIGERLELTHRSMDRKIFAQGALKAVHWLVKQAPGYYNMRDALGMND